MKKLLLITILALSFNRATAQLDFLPKFIRKMYLDKDTTKKSSFVLLPALSSSPETGLEVGGAALLSFYTDTSKQHKTNVSSVFGYATLTVKGQLKLSLNANYWTPQNKIHYVSSISYYNFPFNFYGIGNNTRLANVDLVYEKRYKFNFESDIYLGSDLYLGYILGAFKYYYKFDRKRGDILNSDPLVQDKRGGTAVYAGPTIIYDTRNNNTYTTKGMIINAYCNFMHGAFINSGYEGAFFNIEYSEFFALDKRLVLGLDVQEQSLIGGRSPFYLLPQMGSDELMRGYYEGRYRDRNYIAGQTELRYRISNRFGLAGFMGTGEVFHNGFDVSQLKPNYGGGVRYFFDVEKGLSVRMDYGVGQKPTGEKRETGFYIGLGQAF